MKKPSEDKTLLKNKRAFHDYAIEDTVEAGMVLWGSEVKALRAGQGQLSDAYILPESDGLYLKQMKIEEYRHAHTQPHPVQRARKLLVHRVQLARLTQATRQKGYTLLPLEVYSKDGKIKVLVGLCKGKREYDKRSDQKKKDAARDISRALSRKLPRPQYQ